MEVSCRIMDGSRVEMQCQNVYLSVGDDMNATFPGFLHDLQTEGR